MTTRTCRIMGVAFGDPVNPATITVDFAGIQVFSGTIPTRSGEVQTIPWNEHDILCSWTTNVDLGSTVAVSIAPVNGTVTVSGLTMNNRESATIVVLRSDVTWPGHQPGTLNELQADRLNLSDGDFNSKYGFDVSQMPSYIEVQQTIPTENNFQPFPNKSHLNPSINERLLPERQPGNINPSTGKPYPAFPHYTLSSGDILRYNLLLSK